MWMASLWAQGKSPTYNHQHARALLQRQIQSNETQEWFQSRQTGGQGCKATLVGGTTFTELSTCSWIYSKDGRRSSAASVDDHGRAVQGNEEKKHERVRAHGWRSAMSHAWPDAIGAAWIVEFCSSFDALLTHLLLPLCSGPANV